MLRRRIKTPITRSPTRNKMQTPKIKVQGFRLKQHLLLLLLLLLLRCVRRKPWTWPSTRNRMQTTKMKVQSFRLTQHWLLLLRCVRRKPWTWPSTRNRMQTTNFKTQDEVYTESLSRSLNLIVTCLSAKPGRGRGRRPAQLPQRALPW
jgi:hypothetical protein